MTKARSCRWSGNGRVPDSSMNIQEHRCNWEQFQFAVFRTIPIAQICASVAFENKEIEK